MRDTVLTLKRLFGEEWKNLMLLSIAAAVFSLPLITTPVPFGAARRADAHHGRHLRP